MPELEHNLEAWRRALLSSGHLRAWQVDELEDHLREAYGAAREIEADQETAWKTALESIGRVNALTREFHKADHMSPTAKLAGIALVLALLLLILAAGPGGAGVFLHLPALLCLTVFVLGGLVASFGPGRVGRALGASLRASTPLEAAEVEHLAQVLRRGQRLAWMGGLVLAIVGAIQCLAALDDPSRLGFGLATSSLSVLYGALLAEVGFGSAQQWLRARAAA